MTPVARPHRDAQPARGAVRLASIALLLVSVGCSGTVDRTAPTSVPPTTAASPPAASPPAASPSPLAAGRMPLVLATHPARRPLAISEDLAEQVIAGHVGSWRTLAAGRGPLRLAAGPAVPAVPAGARHDTDRAAVAAAEQDAAVVAVVPATAVGPGVQVVTVAGRDPIRNPRAYPLKVPGPSPGRPVTASFVGDVMLGRRVGEAMARSGDFAAPLRGVAERLSGADLTVGTLECALSEAGPPRQGEDSFAGDPRALAGLRLAGFDVLTLANNHVGDFGPRALVETVREVREAGIVPVGAGENADSARRGMVVERDGVRFGFLAFNAIGETPEARADRPGAAQLRMRPRLGSLDRSGLERLLDQVRDLRASVDILVVLPHWGQQYTNQPVGDQRTVARALVEAGADLVVGSHPHWVQGAEVHQGRLVAYSLGNFVFDMDFSQETQEAVVLEAVFWGSALKSARFMPVRIGDGFAPRFVSWDDGQPILRRLWAASGPPFKLPG